MCFWRFHSFFPFALCAILSNCSDKTKNSAYPTVFDWACRGRNIYYTPWYHLNLMPPHGSTLTGTKNTVSAVTGEARTYLHTEKLQNVCSQRELHVFSYSAISPCLRLSVIIENATRFALTHLPHYSTEKIICQEKICDFYSFLKLFLMFFCKCFRRLIL